MSGGLGAIGPAGNPSSPIHRLDPRAALIGLLGVTVVAVSAPLAAWPVYVACGLVLAAVAAAARVEPAVVWRRARVVLPLILVVAASLPFLRGGPPALAFGGVEVSEQGLRTFGEVSVKATIGTVSAVLLAATATFPGVLRALESLRTPRLLVLTASFMFRYVFVIADEARRMRTALSARGYHPRHLLASGALGRMVGALFLRSYARGERVYLAMLARGFTGSVPHLAPLSFGRRDLVFVGAVALVLVPVRVVS
jgi:cobalt/nickel transport system permease protein